VGRILGFCFGSSRFLGLMATPSRTGLEEQLGSGSVQGDGGMAS